MITKNFIKHLQK